MLKELAPSLLQAVQLQWMLNSAGKGEYGYCTGALALLLVVVRRSDSIVAVDRRHCVLGKNRVLLGSWGDG